MTDKERIEKIKLDQERHYQEVVFSKEVLRDIDWLIEQAEKQIPQKITGMETKVKALDIETQEVRTFSCSPCPSCEKWITKIYNFCPHCGQRIEE